LKNFVYLLCCFYFGEITMNIYKKLTLFTLFFCGVVQLAHANVRENFYIGVGAVDSINHFKLKVKNPTNQIQVQRKKWRNEILGSCFMGYGHTTSYGLYLAGEVGSYFPKRSIKISRPGVAFVASTYQNRLSVQDYVTGDLLLGYRYSDDLLFYLRGGASLANIQLYQWEDPAVNAPAFDKEKNRAGGRAGFGISYGLTKHIGFGVDYIFTAYQSLRTIFPIQQANLHFEEKNYAHFVGLSLLYSF
jgi:outer membrane immunogenic protein